VALAARAAASAVRVVSVPVVLSSLAKLLLGLAHVGALHAEAVAAGENRRAVVVFGATTGPLSSPAPPIAALVETFLVRLRGAGVVSVAAAGNNGTDACLASPTASRAAVVVAAATYRAKRADGSRVLSRAMTSNYGRCCDLFGPSYSTDTAAGFVAGVAAGICGDPNEPGPGWLVADTLVSNATRVNLHGRLSTPGLLVHAPLSVRRPVIVGPESDWLPIGLGVFMVIAATTI
jgi:hypothetical protein